MRLVKTSGRGENSLEFIGKLPCSSLLSNFERRINAKKKKPKQTSPNENEDPSKVQSTHEKKESRAESKKSRSENGESRRAGRREKGILRASTAEPSCPLNIQHISLSAASRNMESVIASEALNSYSSGRSKAISSFKRKNHEIASAKKASQ